MRKKFVIALSVILITLSGCASGTRVTDTFCLKYEPVYSSKRDTEETRRQIDRNNAVYLEQCEPRK